MLTALFLATISLVASNFDYLAPTTEQAKLVVKVDIEGKLYYTCDDNSLWEVYRVDEREQSWGEWLWGESAPQVTPGTHENPANWAIGEVVQVYPIQWNMSLGELSQCNYVMHNIGRDTVAYLKPVNLKELSVAIEKKAYNKGHTTGYASGYASGYDLGYRLGYKKGYQDAPR